jgi:hypothetical protein
MNVKELRVKIHLITLELHNSCFYIVIIELHELYMYTVLHITNYICYNSYNLSNNNSHVYKNILSYNELQMVITTS